MSRNEIILIAALLMVAVFRLYRKFSRKDTGKVDSENETHSGSSLSSISKDDDYEPYSNKRPD